MNRSIEELKRWSTCHRVGCGHGPGDHQADGRCQVCKCDTYLGRLDDDIWSEPDIPGIDDPGEPQTTLKVEVVKRHTIEIGVYLPIREAWQRREELAAPYLVDDAGNEIWSVVAYSAEEGSS